MRVYSWSRYRKLKAGDRVWLNAEGKPAEENSMSKWTSTAVVLSVVVSDGVGRRSGRARVTFEGGLEHETFADDWVAVDFT